MPEPGSTELIDLKSLEMLAIKKIGEDRVREATVKYLHESKEIDEDPNLSGWEMRGNRPVTIGYSSLFLPFHLPPCTCLYVNK